MRVLCVQPSLLEDLLTLSLLLLWQLMDSGRSGASGAGAP